MHYFMAVAFIAAIVAAFIGAMRLIDIARLHFSALKREREPMPFRPPVAINHHDVVSIYGPLRRHYTPSEVKVRQSVRGHAHHLRLTDDQVHACVERATTVLNNSCSEARAIGAGKQMAQGFVRKPCCADGMTAA